MPACARGRRHVKYKEQNRNGCAQSNRQRISGPSDQPPRCLERWNARIQAHIGELKLGAGRGAALRPAHGPLPREARWNAGKYGCPSCAG
eukprot:scaffold6067_cov112-Isochrysis_galbana.AAC.9